MAVKLINGILVDSKITCYKQKAHYINAIKIVPRAELCHHFLNGCCKRNMYSERGSRIIAQVKITQRWYASIYCSYNIMYIMCLGFFFLTYCIVYIKYGNKRFMRIVWSISVSRWKNVTERDYYWPGCKYLHRFWAVSGRVPSQLRLLWHRRN